MRVKQMVAAVCLALSLAAGLAVMNRDVLNWCDWAGDSGFWSWYFNCPSAP